ncbi:phosphotransferase family protein [Oryzihumus leptocrescens]|uniref:Aminoglycoside phosphotransferase (APT) family kinase protein n=1 Tax=Oryzihumus leptocrescens TaxID=297536 RepID=A0A542ZH34_9MICO|nr:phosphotransferase family protein [Oryzihumus leptocrescens]TQL59626.1 aminoglycoside phosphotransferase (APT) family kinase protein [Oryzihumus leptocrescens]
MVDGLDLEALARFMAPVVGPSDGSLTLGADLIAGGKSNLTYRVTDGSRAWVVRRPPLGHVLATAHDMTREYRVMSALRDTAVPVPHMVALCEDTDVVGAPFYVMELVEGEVLRADADLVGRSREDRAALAHQLIDTLADLHALDPEALGLKDFGHPEGFLERQVRRWGQQLARSRSRDIPGVEELARDLAARVPASQRATIVHGDYRLDNAIVGPDQRIRAVLDWEMATLGDPLCDLGLLPVYALPTRGVAGVVSDGMGPHNGFPPMEEIVERYAARTGLDVTPLPWYTALGYFKLAVICEGIHYRYAHGQTVGPGFERIGAVVAPLVDTGRQALG